MGKSKIYTRTGDRGQTSLVGGTRVSKTHARLEAYGTIDELNAQLGYLSALLPADSGERECLLFVQHQLFVVGAYLATDAQQVSLPAESRISDGAIARLEAAIDTLDEGLPPLKAFILPGGTPAAGVCHICRTVCRRAERRILWLEESEGREVDAPVKQFVNRLSDYLFVLSRKLNNLSKNEEIIWDKNCR